MNAERFLSFASVVFIAALLLQTPSTHAGVVEALVTPRDPLLTAPKELTTGTTLPGDSRSVSCPAEADFSRPLALTDAVDLALCNNTQVRAAWADIKAQAATVGVARAAYLPTLSGSISHRNDTTRFPGASLPTQDITTSPINAAFTWRLFDFGSRGANHTAAMQTLTAALATHHAVLQKTLATVVQNYFDAQVALAVWRAKELSEKIAQHTLEAAKRREAKGAGASGDTLQAATALARARLETNRAQGNYQKAMAVLFYGMGAGPQTHTTLADDLEEPAKQAAQDLSEWLRKAQERHPAIVASKAQLEAARHRVSAARAEGLPTVDFAASYYENGRLDQTATETRTQETVVGITLSIPLFDGFSHSYKIHAAEAQVERKTVELQDTEQQILMDVVKAHADAVAALGNLAAAAGLLATAQEALQAAQRRYDKGAADILEILNTQAAFFDAQMERIRSLAEWHSARLRMLASAGAMNRVELGR